MTSIVLSRMKSPLFLLAAISLLGAIFRFYCLGYQSLWLDEATSWSHVFGRSFFEMITETRQEPAPPGYFVLLWFSTKIFGDSEWCLRLPSAVAGTLCIPAIYLLARELFDRRVGVFAAAIVATNHRFIYFSQEARSYSTLLLFLILSSFFLLRLLSDARTGHLKIKNLIGFVGFCGLGFYAHYAAAVAIATYYSILLFWIFYLGQTRAFKGLLRASAILVVLVTPLLPHFWRNFVNPHPTILWIQQPALVDVPDYFLWLFGFEFSLILTVAAICVSILSIRFSNWKSSKGVLLLLLLLLGPIAILSIKSIISFPVLTHRTFLIVSPAIFIFLAHASLRLPLRGAVLCLVSWAFFTVIHLQRSYFGVPTKEETRTALQSVHDPTASKTITVVGPYFYETVINYYQKKQNLNVRFLSLSAMKEYNTWKDLGDFYYFEWRAISQSDEQAMVILREHFDPIEQMSFFRLFVRHYIRSVLD